MSNCNRFRLLLGVLAATSVLFGQVQVREDRLTLTTYDGAIPSPNPQFPQFSENEFPNYPYPILRNEGKTQQPADWRVIVLENEYLSCRILPDLSGYLYGCTDKISKKEVFYTSPDLRRSNSFRQAASSFPFPLGRLAAADAAWSVEDGVGRVTIEDTDRVSGMGWRDEFILRPGSAELEQRVTLHNTRWRRQQSRTTRKRKPWFPMGRTGRGWRSTSLARKAASPITRILLMCRAE